MYPEMTGRRLLTGTVELDESLNVTGEWFGERAHPSAPIVDPK